MHRRSSGGRALCALAACLVGCVASAQPPSSPSLQTRLAELIERNPRFVRIGHFSGPADFSPQVTREMWSGLPIASRVCSTRILDAQLGALGAYARDASRSFRNCEIDDGRGWIRRRLADFRAHVDGNRAGEAARAVGDALAGIQSFYTFTNYVELLAERHSDWEDASAARARVWTDEPLGIDESRLLSHFSAVATPNRCGDRAPDLDKSGAGTDAGARIIRPWGMTAHEAAVELAQADMAALLAHANHDRPGYADRCGNRLLFGFIPSDW